MIRIPCTICGFPHPLRTWLGRLDRAWPAQRCVGLLCPGCRRYVHARIETDRVTPGRLLGTSFADAAALTVRGIRATWSPQGVDVAYDTTVLTVAAR